VPQQETIPLGRAHVGQLGENAEDGLVDAAMDFEQFRLPELFAGFSRKALDTPVRFPVACHPQAWAAGTMPYLLQTMLGLIPDRTKPQIRVVRPVLPRDVSTLDLHGIRVGGGRASLRFCRSNERVIAEVLQLDDGLSVLIDSANR